MPKLYLSYTFGDEVFTNQVKPGQDSPGFADCTADEYLQSIRDLLELEKGQTRYFKPTTPAPMQLVIYKRPAGRVYGPLWPNEAQARKNAQRIEYEKESQRQRDYRRLSRQYGWDYVEVVSIASAAYIKGLEAAGLPEDEWPENVKEAMEQAKKHVQAWQDFEVKNYKEKYEKANQRTAI